MRLIVNPFFRLIFLFAFTGLLVWSVSEGLSIKQRIGNVVFDTYVNIKPRQATFRSIFIDIDDESLSKVGQWPWPRHVMAELIRNISAEGAAVIVFDGVLAEPDRTSPENIAGYFEEGDPLRDALEKMPSYDASLSDAIRESGNFVSGFTRGSNMTPPQIKRQILVKPDIKEFLLAQKDPESLYFSGTAQFLPQLQEATTGNGSYMASAEGDAVIRRTGLVFHNDKELYPSLILEAIRLYEHEGKEYVKVMRNEDYSNYTISDPLFVQIGRYKVPMDSEGKMWVYYREFDDDKETIPAYKFLGKDYKSEDIPDIKNKIVFIASSAEGLMDLRATPIGMQPGVKVHMNALEQILQNKYLIRPYAANDLEIIPAVLISVILIVLSFFVNPVWLAAIAVSCCFGAFALSWYLFITFGGLLDPVAPAILILLVFLAASILRFIKTEADRRQVRQAFGLYISPDFMKELTEHPDKLRLGGEIRELTVMFTDIRNFTSISEGLKPEELIQLMNDFLTPMSDLVMQNRGTIDKYMGDAMMAFWNAPLDDPEHARHACAAALGMQAALDAVNEKIRARFEAQGRPPVVLNCGIGLNTGRAAVGNMGSKQRFAYSILGDSVNLASRLEGQTKAYGVGSLIGEATQEKIPDFATLELDLMRVKGKTQPVRIFTLIGDPQKAQAEEFRSWKKDHDEMIALYRGRKFEQAFNLIKGCREKSGGRVETVYATYSERCVTMMKKPPPESWDGVYEATTK